MNINEMVEWKKDWEREHAEDFASLREEDFRGYLNYMAMGLAGEVGEMANLVKKIERKRVMGGGDITEEMEALREETVDAFTYLLYIAGHLDIDLEKETMEKHIKLERKFKRLKEDAV